MQDTSYRAEHAPVRERPEREDERLPPPDRSDKPKPRGRGVRPFAVLLLLGLVAFGIYQVLTQSNPPNRSGNTARTAAQPVGAAPVSKGDIRIIVDALGTVTPLATVTVKTQINGQLTAVGFNEGQIVKKGDFLAQIDQRPYEIAQVQYEGQLVHDQGVLGQAKMDMTRYESLVPQPSHRGNSQSERQHSYAIGHPRQPSGHGARVREIACKRRAACHRCAHRGVSRAWDPL
jgi:multidrug efflux system membrane fusion protein